MFYDKKKKQYWSKQGTFNAPRVGFNSNHARDKALNELENPNTIYMLGGTPTYLHSSQVYWKAGLTTAENTLRKHLFKLADEQKRLMQQKINYIETQWETILKTFDMNWEEFSKTYKQIYNEVGEKSGNNWEALAALKQMKDFKTTLTAIEAIKDEPKSPQEKAKRLIESGFFAEGDIVFSKNGGKIIKYLKTDTNLKYQIEEAYYRALDKLQKTPAFKKLRTDQQEALIKGVTSGKQFHTSVGSAQEIIEEEVFSVFKGREKEIIEAIHDGKDIFQSIIGNILQSRKSKKNNKNSLEIMNIAGENWQKDYENLNTDRFKADSADVLTINGKTVHFFSTMKTGEIFDYARNYRAESFPPIFDAFTAAMNAPSGLDYSKINDSTGASAYHSIHGKDIESLMNYVYRNAPAAATATEIQNFRDYTICYYIWLRALVEVVGNPQQGFTVPIALKMFDKIYKTSDILKMFIKLEADGWLKPGVNLINKKYLANFYTWKNQESFVQSKSGKNRKKKIINHNGQGDLLFQGKRWAINDIIKDGAEVTYRELYTEMGWTLNNLAVSKMQLPTFSASFRIALDNIERTLDI